MRSIAHEERMEAAARFVFTWLIICAKYECRTYMDFRVQKARREYVAARKVSELMRKSMAVMKKEPKWA